MRALADREKKNDSYIYDVLRAGCLSPILVERIIKDDSRSIPLEALLKPLPISWDDQSGLLSGL